jgi:hypothetical protein
MSESFCPVEGVAISANTFGNILEAITVKGSASTQGVFRGMLDDLEVTGTTSPVTVATGVAFVKEGVYTNSTSVDVAIPTPTTATRIDRIVLRLDYTASPWTCTVQRLAGAEGAGAPGVTQTEGTKWEISLAKVAITTAGVITVTDERAFVGDGQVVNASLADGAVMEGKIASGAVTETKIATGAVTETKIATGAVTENKIATGAVTAAKIANRTRVLYVPALYAYNVTVSDEIVYDCDFYSWNFFDNKSSLAVGRFRVPGDFDGSLVVKALVRPASSGNVYVYHQALYGALNEQVGNHNNTNDFAAVSVTSGVYNEISSLTLTDANIGDNVSLKFQRDATNAQDTVDNTMRFMGWIVTYTADS